MSKMINAVVIILLFVSPLCTMESTTYLNDPFRETIIEHARHYPDIFSEEGLSKTSQFLEKFKKLIDFAILLRGENEAYQNDILDIGKDHKKLRDISSNNTCSQDV